MKPMTYLLTAAVLCGSLGLGACESTQTSKVPGGASQVASATGDTSYRTADAGTIYIYDKTWNKLVYTGSVLPDQMVKVEPENSRVLIDGRAVVEQTPLGGGDRFEIYLDSHDRTASRTTTVERRVVTEHENHD